ncbi:MAG: Mov34/MPN/PAD-1 family protein [Lachnospiraceae bacterium]|nr:Mov34/MPN/PAD-1 family protein [Lachnospiraceae bacterium]
MNDFLAAFGLSEGDLQEEKKKPAKKSENKGSKKKKDTDKKYPLPISLCGGIYRCVFEDEKESVWNENTLKTRVRSKFPELSGIYLQVKEMKSPDADDGKGAYIRPEIMFKEFTKEEALEFPLEVVAGDFSMPFDIRLSLDEIRNLIAKSRPEFKLCKFHYDEKQKILIPFMEPNAPAGQLYKLPISVGYTGIMERYENTDFENDTAEEADIREKYANKYPEFKDCEFAFLEEEHMLIPIMKTNSSQEAKKNISLPIELRAGAFKLILKAEDFGGKKTATLDEIQKILEEYYPEYTKERTEMVYDAKHFVVPILKSSRKGLEIISTNPDWKHEIIVDEKGNEWRVETTPFAIFKYNRTENAPVEFTLRAPRIPIVLIKQTILIFKKNPNLERAVQIFYDKKNQNYELYEPVQETAAATVIFERNHEKEQEMSLVMDIHSHGMYRAFFSMTDNYDEKGIRFYMVIGNLDREDWTCALRAGLAGHFGEVHPNDIFD